MGVVLKPGGLPEFSRWCKPPGATQNHESAPEGRRWRYQPHSLLFRIALKGDGRQRRQADQKRMRAPLPRKILGLEATHVSDVAAAVGFCVGVNDLAIEARAGDAEPVTLPHQRRRVHRKHDHLALRSIAA